MASTGTQIAEPLRIGAARRGLREADQLERPLNRRQEIVAAGNHLLRRSRHHLLGAGSGRNEPHSHLDQAHIGFARGLHAIGMQADLAATAEREARRGDDDRYLRVPQSHGGLLELPDDEVDVVPVLFLCFEEQQHQVGAGGEVRRVVADHERGEVLFRFAHARLQHLQRVGADRVHLGVELDREHAIANVHEAGPGVLLDDARAGFGVAEKLQVARGR